MVIYNGSYHCFCDFFLCTAEIEISNENSREEFLKILIENGWKFKIEDQKKISEIYCNRHKYRIREDCHK